MARNQFFDVVPPNKRSIRDIPVPQKRGMDIPKAEEGIPVEEGNIGPGEREVKTRDSYEPPSYKMPDGYFNELSNRKKNNMWKWIIGILVFVAVVYSISFAFHNAKVTFTPQTATLPVAGTFIARTSPAPDQIMFDTFTLTDTSSKVVEAAGEKQVERKASGRITIFNNFSNTSQQLVKNTRFESQAGKIYRIMEDVKVPGQSEVDGKTVPGSIEVTVFADQAGEAYNTSATDFTIPGFKGTPRYDKFYAKGVGAISGGFVGKEQSVESSLLASTELELKKGLETSLLKSAESKIPKDFLLLPGASTFTYKSLPIAPEDNKAKVSIEGTLVAYVFRKADLESVIAQASSASSTVPFKKMRIVSYENLSVVAEPQSTSSISVIANGNVNAAAVIDEAKLIEEIKGKPRKNILAILASYPEISTAEVKITPPWIMSVPKNTEDITIIDTSLTLTDNK